MHRKATAIAALLATTITLAACGGSSPSSSNPTSKSRVSAGLKMAQCVRAHGVPHFPDPGSGPSQVQASSSSGGGGPSVSVDGVQLNVNPQKLQQAMSACQKYAPPGKAISGAQLAKIKQGALKMAECMRAHGVSNFPDPQISTGPGGKGVAVRIGGPGQAGSGSFNPNSPAVKKAQQTCMPLLGAGPKAQKAR